MKTKSIVLTLALTLGALSVTTHADPVDVSLQEQTTTAWASSKERNRDNRFSVESYQQTLSAFSKSRKHERKSRINPQGDRVQLAAFSKSRKHKTNRRDERDGEFLVKKANGHYQKEFKRVFPDFDNKLNQDTPTTVA